MKRSELISLQLLAKAALQWSEKQGDEARRQALLDRIAEHQDVVNPADEEQAQEATA